MCQGVALVVCYGSMQKTPVCVFPQMGFTQLSSTVCTRLVVPSTVLSRRHRAGDAEGTQTFALGPHG